MIEYSYATEIAEADRSVILESRIYKEWLKKTQEKFVVTKVHFASVDYLAKGRQPPRWSPCAWDYPCSRKRGRCFGGAPLRREKVPFAGPPATLCY